MWLMLPTASACSRFSMELDEASVRKPEVDASRSPVLDTAREGSRRAVSGSIGLWKPPNGDALRWKVQALCRGRW